MAAAAASHLPVAPPKQDLTSSLPPKSELPQKPENLPAKEEPVVPGNPPPPQTPAPAPVPAPAAAPVPPTPFYLVTAPALLSALFLQGMCQVILHALHFQP